KIPTFYGRALVSPFQVRKVFVDNTARTVEFEMGVLAGIAICDEGFTAVQPRTQPQLMRATKLERRVRSDIEAGQFLGVLGLEKMCAAADVSRRARAVGIGMRVGRAVQGANGAVERNGLLVQPNLETVRPLSRVLRPELVDQTSSSVLMPVVVVTGRNKAKLGGIARRAVYACFVQV